MESDEDDSHVSTPVAPHQSGLPIDPKHVDGAEGIDSFSASLASMLHTSLHLNDSDVTPPDNHIANLEPRMLTLPIPSAIPGERSSAFVLPEIQFEEITVSLDDLQIGRAHV